MARRTCGVRSKGPSPAAAPARNAGTSRGSHRAGVRAGGVEDGSPGAVDGADGGGVERHQMACRARVLGVEVQETRPAPPDPDDLVPRCFHPVDEGLDAGVEPGDVTAAREDPEEHGREPRRCPDGGYDRPARRSGGTSTRGNPGSPASPLLGVAPEPASVWRPCRRSRPSAPGADARTDATIVLLAGVAELADARDSKSRAPRGVWVRFPPPASAQTVYPCGNPLRRASAGRPRKSCGATPGQHALSAAVVRDAA